MGHAKADRLLIRPTHGDRAGAGDEGGQVPLRAPTLQAGQYSGHALATATSLRSLRQEPVDATLTVSIQPSGHRSRAPSGLRIARRCPAGDRGYRLSATSLAPALITPLA